MNDFDPFTAQPANMKEMGTAAEALAQLEAGTIGGNRGTRRKMLKVLKKQLGREGVEVARSMLAMKQLLRKNVHQASMAGAIKTADLIND